MNRRVLMIALMLVHLTVSLCGECFAGSIYAKRDRNSKPIYSDDKAYRIGDVLTIIIVENTKVDNKIERDLERESSRELNFNGNDVGFEHIIPNVPSFKINTGSKKTLEGKADYKEKRTFEDRITVIVQDVHQNGNLVILGTRIREVSGDKQTIHVSGIVRPADIAFDNTIKSELVANFNLISINDGVSANYNNPGWLGKILDKLWPF